MQSVDLSECDARHNLRLTVTAVLNGIDSNDSSILSARFLLLLWCSDAVALSVVDQEGRKGVIITITLAKTVVANVKQ